MEKCSKCFKDEDEIRGVIKCKSCKDYYCVDCVMSCDLCKKATCIDCFKKCDKCSKAICKKCSTTNLGFAITCKHCKPMSYVKVSKINV